LLGRVIVRMLSRMPVSAGLRRAVPLLFVVVAAGTSLALAACVQVQAPTDTGDPVTTAGSAGSSGSGPVGTTTPPVTSATGPFSYNQDIKAILDGDCLACHGPRRADGGYSVANYAQTMQAVRAASSGSALITVTRSGGSMFRYWSGSTTARQTKAEMVRVWIVNNNAQENR